MKVVTLLMLIVPVIIMSTSVWAEDPPKPPDSDKFPNGEPKNEPGLQSDPLAPSPSAPGISNGANIAAQGVIAVIDAAVSASSSSKATAPEAAPAPKPEAKPAPAPKPEAKPAPAPKPASPKNVESRVDVGGSHEGGGNRGGGGGGNRGGGSDNRGLSDRGRDIGNKRGI